MFLNSDGVNILFSSLGPILTGVLTGLLLLFILGVPGRQSQTWTQGVFRALQMVSEGRGRVCPATSR